MTVREGHEASHGKQVLWCNLIKIRTEFKIAVSSQKWVQLPTGRLSTSEGKDDTRRGRTLGLVAVLVDDKEGRVCRFITGIAIGISSLWIYFPPAMRMESSMKYQYIIF